MRQSETGSVFKSGQDEENVLLPNKGIESDTDSFLQTSLAMRLMLCVSSA